MKEQAIEVGRLDDLWSSAIDILLICCKGRPKGRRGSVGEFGEFATEDGSVEDGIVQALATVCNISTCMNQEG